MTTSTTAVDILNFIKNTEAFKIMPETYLKLTKNKLITGEWKVFLFKARVKDDNGWEADLLSDGEVYATYCWKGNDEYCITSQDYFDSQVQLTYNSIGKCVFPV